MDFKKVFSLFLLALLLPVLAAGVSQDELNEAQALIGSAADCESLSDEQLELIGEYYMESMHPGELHELMHQRMGLVEGSKAEELFHVRLAYRMYCASGDYAVGMMGGSRMMGRFWNQTSAYANYGMIGGRGMMSGTYGGSPSMMNYWFADSAKENSSQAWDFVASLTAIFLVVLIAVFALAAIWLYKQLARASSHFKK